MALQRSGELAQGFRECTSFVQNSTSVPSIPAEERITTYSSSSTDLTASFWKQWAVA